MRRHLILIRSILYFHVVLFLSAPLSYAEEGFHSLYEEAIYHYNQRNFKSATIQLKNVLQQKPNHLPSRLLIGRIYFINGDLPEAEKSLRLALSMGAARDQVFSLLGNVLLTQRKHHQLLQTLTMSSLNAPEAELTLVFRGRAHLELGQYAEALNNFEQALEVSPNSVEALLGKSAALVASGELTEAEKLIDLAARLKPPLFSVWYEKGLLREASNDINGALESYNRALSLNPKSIKTIVARASLYLRIGQPENTRNDLKPIYERYPYDLNAALLYAQALARLGHIEDATDVVETMQAQLARISENVILQEPLLLRAATLIKYISKDFEQANAYATRYIALRPNSPEIIKLLTAIKLHKGQYDDVIALLYPLQRHRTEDVEILALLGEALLFKGQFVQASTVFEKAVELAPNNAKLNTRLGLSHIGMGLDKNGIDDLQRALQLNTATSVNAGVILTQVQLRQGEQTDALTTAKKLINRQPENPILYNLLGGVYLSLKSYDSARKSFEKASALRPEFLGSEYNLVLLDIHEKHYADARRRLNAIFSQHRESQVIYVAYSDLELAEGNTDQAISWLKKAVESDNASPQAIKKLVRIYIDTGNSDQALKQAEKMLHSYPDHKDSQLILARAQMNSQLYKPAIYNFKKAIGRHLYSVDTLLDVAALQVELKDYNGARHTLFKASTSSKVKATSALIRLDMRTNDLESAQRRAIELTKMPASTAQGQQFIGDIALRRSQYQKALSAYKRSLDATPSPLAAQGIFKTTFLLGWRKEAIEWLERWSIDHPEDVVARRNLARTYLSLNQFNEAQIQYEKLVQDGNDDAIIYSRLARIYQLNNDPRAKETAEKALFMAPFSPIALDVYGWILVTDGAANDGLKYLREAVSRDSDPLIRYHLATALSELGRSEEARKELHTILNSKEKLPWSNSALQLYDSLRQTASNNN